jgi:hypothetical protein
MMIETDVRTYVHIHRQLLIWCYRNSSTNTSSTDSSLKDSSSTTEKGPVHRPTIHRPVQFIDRHFNDRHFIDWPSSSTKKIIEKIKL